MTKNVIGLLLQMMAASLDDYIVPVRHMMKSADNSIIKNGFVA